MIELRTPRLHIIAATVEIARAEVYDRSLLAELLNAQLPADWPPPLNDAASARFFLDTLTKDAEAAGWMAWYFIAVDAGQRLAIGNGGFKGPPSDGAVEVGYSIVPRFQRLGLANEAVGALIGWAFSHDAVDRVVAQTYPELHASQALLRKLGFSERASTEPGVLRFELKARDAGGPVAQRS